MLQNRTDTHKIRQNGSSITDRLMVDMSADGHCLQNLKIIILRAIRYTPPPVYLLLPVKCTTNVLKIYKNKKLQPYYCTIVFSF